MSPLLSIIVPIYNTEMYLEECIQSIINQKYANFELILINDGSTDSSLDICNYYSEQDNRIKVISTENLGVSNARNLGINISKGDYIGFVDSDDFIHENMYLNLINAIERTNSDIAYLKMGSMKKTPYNKEEIIDKYTAIKKLFLLNFPASLCSNLYSKKLFEGNYLNTSIHFFEDFEFNYRLLNNSTNNIVGINGELYYYRTHENNSNHAPLNMKRLTSLQIENKIKINCKELDKYAINSYIHFLISAALSAAKSNYTTEQRNIMKRYAKKILGEYPLYKAETPLTYKTFLVIFSYAPILTIKILRFLSKIRRSK